MSLPSVGSIKGLINQIAIEHNYIMTDVNYKYEVWIYTPTILDDNKVSFMNSLKSHGIVIDIDIESIDGNLVVIDLTQCRQ